MEFSFDTEPSRGSNRSSNSSTIGSDRLRKAIERNRAKQAKRATQTARVSAAGRGSQEEWSLPSGGSAQGTSSTRRNVGSADNVEFTTAIRKGNHKAPAPVSYKQSSSRSVAKRPTRNVTARSTTTRKTKKKSKLLKNTNEYVIKGIWVFFGILLLRLVFSDGGVQDYYAKKEVLQGRYNELARIQKENEGLLKEISLLKEDPRYQKKVVRDHLGYIAEDEYLVLFPET